MSDDDKAALDHLAKFANDRWREYDHKSQAEWKLSYAVWGALLAAGAAILTQQDAFALLNMWILIGAALLFCGAAVIIHKSFLDFIHLRLKTLRQEMRPILHRRQTLLGLPTTAKAPANDEEDEEHEMGRESLQIQWTITWMLAAFVVLAAVAIKL